MLSRSDEWGSAEGVYESERGGDLCVDRRADDGDQHAVSAGGDGGRSATGAGRDFSDDALDLFSYFLGGTKAVEFTEASTTQMYALGARDWDWEMLGRVGVLAQILPQVVQPGTMLSVVERDAGGVRVERKVP